MSDGFSGLAEKFLLLQAFEVQRFIKNKAEASSLEV